MSETTSAGIEQAPPSAAVTTAPPTGLGLANEQFQPNSQARELATGRRSLRRLQRVVTAAVFVASIGLGLIIYGLGNQPVRPSPFPTGTTVAEPAAAAELARALSREDAGMLAETVDGRILQSLDGSLEPIVHVTEVRFLGAVSLGSDTVVAYLVRGKDAQGQKLVRAFALHVQGEQVVGVN